MYCDGLLQLWLQLWLEKAIEMFHDFSLYPLAKVHLSRYNII